VLNEHRLLLEAISQGTLFAFIARGEDYCEWHCRLPFT
jgi:hypothetical protein